MKSIRPVRGQPIPEGWFAALWDDVRALVCHGDGRRVFVRQTATGQIISSTGEDVTAAESGSVYDGVFKLTKTATGVSVGAGVAVVNGTVYEVAASTLTCSGAGWVYLESTSGESPTVEFSSSKPGPGGTEDDPTGVFPLGKVTAAGVVTQLCRSVPQLIVIGTDCTEESGSGDLTE